MEGEEEVELSHLRAVLERETKSRRRQEELNSKLQEAYDVLLKQLAQAELQIDKFRFQSKVDINKQFIVSHHHTSPTSFLQEMLDSHKQGQEDTIHSADVACGNDNSEEFEEDKATNSQDNKQDNKSSLLQHLIQDGDDSVLLLSLLEGSAHQSKSSDSNADNTSLTISEDLSDLSANYISAQTSQHLAQIFHVRSLQEQVATLKDKLNRNEVSFKELSNDLDYVLEEHEKLTRNFAASSQQVGDAELRDNSKATARRREALENEVNLDNFM